MGKMSKNDVPSIGRPVRVLSLSFPQGMPAGRVSTAIEREAATGVDLVALPELWSGQEHHTPEAIDGPTVSAMAKLALGLRTYIVCPLDRLDEGRRFNSAVLIDRAGKVVCVYDKAYPYWSEYDLEPPVQPGCRVPVYQADFGKVGMATCFDVNFPEVWQLLAEGGAELVVWPSAYSGGTTLQAHALAHHYYVISSTLSGDCLVYDITGRRILHERIAGLNCTRVTLDLDRGINHENFNSEKLQELLAEHPDDAEKELHLPMEAWFVLRAKRPGVSARALAKEYGLEELREYIQRSQREIDLKRAKPLRP